LRSTVAQLGYGEADDLDDDAEIEGELDDNTLAVMHLAGARFNRLIEILLPS
ncbi:unnamed protein product, partial [marine sediment metagenome]